MDFILRIGDRFVRLDGRYLIKERIDYNPFPFGEIAGFYLKGNRILPVVDLQKVLNLKRGSRRVFLISDDVVFTLEYDSLSKSSSGEEIDLNSIFEEVKRRLDGRS